MKFGGLSSQPMPFSGHVEKLGSQGAILAIFGLDFAFVGRRS
jgi:hypothetical protein